MAVFFLFTIINNYQLLFIGTKWDLSLTITPQTDSRWAGGMVI